MERLFYQALDSDNSPYSPDTVIVGPGHRKPEAPNPKLQSLKLRAGMDSILLGAQVVSLALSNSRFQRTDRPRAPYLKLLKGCI